MLIVDEIRQDIEDCLGRLKPWKAEDGSCYFGGWARMAQPLIGFNVVEVCSLLEKESLNVVQVVKFPTGYYQ